MQLKDRTAKLKDDFKMLNHLIMIRVNNYIGKNLMEVKEELEKELGVDEVIYYEKEGGNSSYNNNISDDEEFWGTAKIVGNGRVVYDDGLMFNSDFETIYVDIEVKVNWDFELDKPKQ